MFNKVRTLTASIGLLVVVLVVPAFAQAQQTCQVHFSKDQQLKVSDCTTRDLRQVEITTRDGHSIRTRLVVNFPRSSLLWTRVRVAQGDGRFSVDDQRRLRELASLQLNASTEARSILDVLANFLEPGIAVENFDADELAFRKQKQRDFLSTTETNAFGSWTPICSLIGTIQKATYGGLDDGSTGARQSLWPVGDFQTKCKGRCGWGCAQFLPQHRSNQYTMECFNHDVCHAETGKQLGPCGDAFWAAAASYVFAPDCPLLQR